MSCVSYALGDPATYCYMLRPCYIITQKVFCSTAEMQGQKICTETGQAFELETLIKNIARKIKYPQSIRPRLSVPTGLAPAMHRGPRQEETKPNLTTQDM